MQRKISALMGDVAKGIKVQKGMSDSPETNSKDSDDQNDSTKVNFDATNRLV